VNYRGSKPPQRDSHIARKRFGQHFLIDEGIITSIVQAIAPQTNDAIVEIGPGLGALTRPLLSRLAHLHVIEIDRDLSARLRTEYSPTVMSVHEGDALLIDLSTIGSNLRITGNLPYNISTPILFRLAQAAHLIQDIHVMLQREVVERMSAGAGDSSYSRLSVMLQYRYHIEYLFDVPPAAFDPIPRVDSAVVRLIPRRPLAPAAIDEKLFAHVVARAFAQRRKTLRNTLRGVLTATELETLGVSPNARAQELTVADFVRLADYLSQHQPHALADSLPPNDVDVDVDVDDA